MNKTQQCKTANAVWPLASLPALAFALALGLASQLANAADCAPQCGLQQDKSYPNLVVGTLVSLPDEKQSGDLFASMRSAKRWLQLPEDAKPFWDFVQPVTIKLPSGRIYTVMITQEEAKAAPLRPGDLVRYSPHRGAYEKPPADPVAAAYWGITGCVAGLCSASDKSCAPRYRTGVFRANDGTALTEDGAHTDPKAQNIDPVSMLPQPNR